eukprot:2123643-Prymnesium_polylepis.1
MASNFLPEYTSYELNFEKRGRGFRGAEARGGAFQPESGARTARCARCGRDALLGAWLPG